MTNARSTDEFNQIERVILPYLKGEAINSLDRIERPALSDRETTEISVLRTDDLLLFKEKLLREEVFTKDTLGCSVKLIQSSQGIEIAKFYLNRHMVYWLASWKLLKSNEIDSADNPCMVALPYPDAAGSQYRLERQNGCQFR